MPTTASLLQDSYQRWAKACAEIKSAGLTLAVSQDGKLLVSPADKLTPKLRELIREHKAALMELVEARDNLASYLLQDIASGGPYRKLWPQVRDFCRRELTEQQWSALNDAWGIQQ